LDSLKKLAVEMRIKITYTPLGQFYDGLLGLYAPAESTIYLDHSLLRAKNYFLHRCILCEELGHAVTGTTLSTFKVYTNYRMNRRINQEEESALIWATEYLIPTNELLLLLENGYHNCEDLSRYFGTTTWFMFRKLHFLNIGCKDKRDIIQPVIINAKLTCV